MSETRSDQTLTDELFDMLKLTIEARFESDKEAVDGLACVDAMVNVLTYLIDEAPDKNTKDMYALYASSLIVTNLQDLAAERGEEDSLPAGIDADRIATARNIVKKLRGIAKDEEAMDAVMPTPPEANTTLH